MRLVDERTVRELLDYPTCVGLMEGALRALASGKAVQPLRSVVRMPHPPIAVVTMPGALLEPAAVGLKVVSVLPSNRDLGRASHQGFVALFDPADGTLAAFVDGTAITEIRTAAVSTLATRLLARPEATRLTLLGSGAQAAAHVRALAATRTLDEIRVWDRRPERARALAGLLARDDLPVDATEDREAAVRSAEILCTVSGSSAPIVDGSWLGPGIHINAVGASAPGARELTTAAVARARVYVDRRESAWTEADDLRIPRDEGAIAPDHVVGELGELLLGQVPGRRAPDEITLFKSLGLAVEDLAAAQWVAREARSRGLGIDVRL